MKTIGSRIKLYAGAGVLLVVLLAGPCPSVEEEVEGVDPEVQGNITLARGGQSNYTIVIDRHCSPSERHGAEELQMFLEQICGAELPISRVKVTGPKIVVGRSKALDRLPVDIDFEALGDEGFVIKTVGPHLVLAGGPVRGTMYACYEFLDKYLGCRWFTPEVSRIPRQETIILPDMDYKKIPMLEYREPYYFEARDGDWAARNRINAFNADLEQQHGGKILYLWWAAAHTFHGLVNPDTYFKEHPEYFPLIDGKRTYQGAQLCLTNSEIVKIATETLGDWLRTNPPVDMVSVSQMDTGGYCECEECRALTEREGSLAGPVLHFVNQIADNIRDEFPNVAIHTLAYSQTRKPPRYVQPRPNVIVQLANIECYGRPLSTWDSEKYRRYREDIAGWSKICNRLYVWDYVTNFGNYIIPFPNLYSLQPNIKFFVDHNVKGIFAQGVNPRGGEFAELRSYILARSLWNPDCDWSREMDEFLAAYYGGPAAGPIRHYIDILHQKVQEDNIHGIFQSPEYLPTEIIRKFDELFDEAEAAVADDPVRLRRVKKERLSIEYIKISRHVELLPAVQEYEAAVEEFARIAKEWGITNFSQGALLDKKLQQWREDVQGYKGTATISEGEVGVLPLEVEWQFATDPDDIGTAEKWFANAFNDSQWAVVSSKAGAGGWGPQGFLGYTGIGYTGFGWYRQAVGVPAEWARYKFVYLYFGAVDEDAYIYLNGEPVYEHSCASTGLAPEVIWETPFAFDAKPHLKFGQDNPLAVRVYSSAGMGGIYLPVYLIGADRALEAGMMKALVEKSGH